MLNRILNLAYYRPLRLKCGYLSIFQHVMHRQQHQMINLEHQNISFNISYHDVGCKNAPVIMAMHGAPGLGSDFSALFDPLSNAGYRIIAIDFPGKLIPCFL